MRWLLYGISKSAARPPHSRLGTRSLSTIASGLNDAGRVSVPVGISGSVHIDLYNLAKVSSSEPLLVYLPPFSTAASTSGLTQLPRFAHQHATAVIHYRWVPNSSKEETPKQDFSDGHQGVREYFHPTWPTPIHDTLKAYTWIVENLAPASSESRDIYVYGSHLGASLATSLALTESHSHERMAVRGCVAYNGIYNWTTFLPDHRINKPPSAVSGNLLEEILAHSGDPDFQALKKMSRELFDKPDDFFDPFASSCLLFQTPGLLVPPSFDDSAISPPTALTDLLLLTEDEIEQLTPPVPPTRSQKRWLGFPPRTSTLKIPEMLLLHDTTPPLPPSFLRRRQRRQKKSYRNGFQIQAKELASLMQRSIKEIELGERTKWDESVDEGNDEADRRVQVHDVGVEGSDVATAEWLEERMSAFIMLIYKDRNHMTRYI